MVLALALSSMGDSFQEEICLCPRADSDYVTNIYVRGNVQSWLLSGQVEVGQVNLQ